jgi:SAM-dependent methyltransferase
VPDADLDLRLLGPLEGRRLLELGWSGRAAEIAARGAHVIVVEPSGTAVGPFPSGVELRTTDLADLAFLRADTIAAAFAEGTLARVEDTDRVFRQVHRVLLPDGPLVITIPHPAAVVLDDGRPYFDRSPLPDGRFHRTIGDLFTSLVRAGFRVDTVIEPVPDPPASLPRTLVVRARKVGT